jgi:hypothetical protein
VVPPPPPPKLVPVSNFVGGDGGQGEELIRGHLGTVVNTSERQV